ncbi:MAG: cache domain-containing protein, partial [Janthinobacterium sp.]
MRQHTYGKARAWERWDTRTLLSLFMAILLAGLWSITVLQLRHAHEAAIAGAGRDARGMARVFDEHAIRTIEAADQAATYLRGRYQALGERLDIVADLRQGLNPGPLYNLFSIIDERGDTVLSSRPFKPTNLADREHIRVHMQRDSGELYISKPVLGRVSKKWSIQLTRRINHADGRFKGVVVVSMDPYYFTRLYDEVDLGDNSSIALVGSDGVVRARRVGAVNTIGQDIGGSKVFSLMRGGTRGSFSARSPVDGTLRFYAFEKLAGYPLYMLVGLDRDTVLADYFSRRDQALLMAAITSALIVLSWAALVLLIGRLVD